MSGLPRYSSSPEAREAWEDTGALAEEQHLRDVAEGRVLDCLYCREYFSLKDEDDWPEKCSKECPERTRRLKLRDEEAKA